MLDCRTVDYEKVTDVENVCEDIENNNTQNKCNGLDDQIHTIHHSSNSKGVLAQVRKKELHWLHKVACIISFTNAVIKIQCKQKINF